MNYLHFVKYTDTKEYRPHLKDNAHFFNYLFNFKCLGKIIFLKTNGMMVAKEVNINEW